MCDTQNRTKKALPLLTMQEFSETESSRRFYLRLIFFKIRFLGSFGFFVLSTSIAKPINLCNHKDKNPYKV
jgi:hypothetical protein